jgi:hypothetical protein
VAGQVGGAGAKRTLQQTVLEMTSNISINENKAVVGQTSWRSLSLFARKLPYNPEYLCTSERADDNNEWRTGKVKREHLQQKIELREETLVELKASRMLLLQLPDALQQLREHWRKVLSAAAVALLKQS